MMDDGSSFLEPPQNPNPNPNPNLNPNLIPYPYTPQAHVHNPATLQTYQPSVDATTTYYYTDTNTNTSISYGQFQISPQFAAPQGITLPTVATQLHVNQNWKKGPKKVRIVQSVWCEVCKINCNSKDVLDNHKLGKKHIKNLEKLNNMTNVRPAPVVTFTSTPPTIPDVHPINKPLIGPQENPVKVPSSKNALKSKKKKLAATEDIDSKRRKVLDGGAAAEAVRTCMYCNVVCNSETVFNYHMAGQKHAATMKKYAAAMAGISFVAG